MKMQTWEMYCETCGRVTEFKRSINSRDINGWKCRGINSRSNQGKYLKSVGEIQLLKGCGKAQTALN